MDLDRMEPQRIVRQERGRQERRREAPPPWPTRRWSLAPFGALLAALVATGCGGGGLEGRAEAPSDVSVSTRASVTVRGNVGRVLGLHAFEVAQSAGEPVLVVVVPPGEVNFAPGERVEVTGTPHQFEVATFESRFGLALDDPRYAALEGTRSLVVNDVKVLPRRRATPEDAR